jgi:hypothetical protein
MTKAHAMTVHGTWLPYGGSAKLELALVLLAIAVGAAVLGLRLKSPARLPRPPRPVAVALFSAWAIAIPAFLVCLAFYIQQYQKEHLHGAHVGNPITPVTFVAAVVTFIVIFALSPDRSGTRFITAAIGAIAGPMIFEFPFDLIVVARVYPPIPPDPAAYLALFFVPLFLIEILTLSFLTLSPMVKLARPTFFSLALMLAVFAGWALEGFTYPYAPLPIAFNVASKLLAFVTVLTLFVPQRGRRAGSVAADTGNVASHDVLTSST